MNVGMLGQNDIFQSRLEIALGAVGINCRLSEDREHFLRTALIEGVDLVVLDWRLAGGSNEGQAAIELLKDIRRWFDGAFLSWLSMSLKMKSRNCCC